MLRPITALAPKMSDWKKRVKVSYKGLHLEAFRISAGVWVLLFCSWWWWWCVCVYVCMYVCVCIYIYKYIYIYK